MKKRSSIKGSARVQPGSSGSCIAGRIPNHGRVAKPVEGRVSPRARKALFTWFFYVVIILANLTYLTNSFTFQNYRQRRPQDSSPLAIDLDAPLTSNSEGDQGRRPVLRDLSSLVETLIDPSWNAPELGGQRESRQRLDQEEDQQSGRFSSSEDYKDLAYIAKNEATLDDQDKLEAILAKSDSNEPCATSPQGCPGKCFTSGTNSFARRRILSATKTNLTSDYVNKIKADTGTSPIEFEPIGRCRRGSEADMLLCKSQAEDAVSSGKGHEKAEARNRDSRLIRIASFIEKALTNLDQTGNKRDLTYKVNSNMEEKAAKDTEYLTEQGVELDRNSLAEGCNRLDCSIGETTDESRMGSDGPHEVKRHHQGRTGAEQIVGRHMTQLGNTGELVHRLIDSRILPITFLRVGETRNQRRSTPPNERRGSIWRSTSTRIVQRRDRNMTNSLEYPPASALADATLALAVNRTLAAFGLVMGPDKATTGVMSGQLVAKQGQPEGDREEQGSSVSSDSPLECNMRRFTYRAVKSDAAGNRCSGMVTATICYGGCDTGEYADWLFPHKKSVHRVCTHGARARRQVLLPECSDASGRAINLDEAGAELQRSLREYSYVDATHCVCERCQSADTACVGSLTRPYLPSLAPEPEGGLPNLVQQHQNDPYSSLLY